MPFRRPKGPKTYREMEFNCDLPQWPLSRMAEVEAMWNEVLFEVLEDE